MVKWIEDRLKSDDSLPFGFSYAVYHDTSPSGDHATRWIEMSDSSSKADKWPYPVAMWVRDQVLAGGIDGLSQAMGSVAQAMKDDGVFNECLQGWRNELYEIFADPASSYFEQHGFKQTSIESNIAFSFERAACAIFGLATFGVHMTAFEGRGEDMKIWVPRRSPTKATWPSMLDNSVAGGIPSGMTPFESMVKECEEEASLADDFVRPRLVQCGVATYFYVTDQGWLQPEVENVYDLPLPVKGSPDYVDLTPLDGEVESFKLIPVKEVLDMLLHTPEQFKPNSGLILVDFLVRHGFITVENEPHLIEIVSRCHRKLTEVPMPVRQLTRASPRTAASDQNDKKTVTENDGDAGVEQQARRFRDGNARNVLGQITRSAILFATLFFVAMACVLPASASSIVDNSTDGHTNNWAVLVCSSRYWFNYRHMANTLGMYRTVKRLGIPDSNIILMLADDVACDARNEFPAAVYANSGRQLDLYGSGVDDAQGKGGGNGIGIGVEVDYRGYEVNVENFMRVLTGRTAPELPPSKHLLTDASSNVFIYLTGHGGDEFLKFQDNEEVSAYDIGDAISQMWEKKRYNRMMLMFDTCQANTLYNQIKSPNVIATGSSALGENSYSHHNDPDIGVAVIDSFTHYVLQYLEKVEAGSKATLQDFFNYYDPVKIKSHPGIRTDLFPFNLNETLLTDFFGGVSNVEVMAEKKISKLPAIEVGRPQRTSAQLDEASQALGKDVVGDLPQSQYLGTFKSDLDLCRSSDLPRTGMFTFLAGVSGGAWYLNRKKRVVK